MSEQPQDQQDQQQQQDPAGGEQQTPPWEREGQQFDPERAWNLITSLRSEREQLRAEREQLNGQVSEFRNSQLTEQQKIEAERDTLRGERDGLATELTRLRVAVRHGLSEEDFDLLGTGTEEEVNARAERIAAMRGASAAPVPTSFDGGHRTPVTAGADMNQLIRRQVRG